MGSHCCARPAQTRFVKGGAATVEGLTWVPASTAEEAMAAIQKAEHSRMVASTMMNMASNRCTRPRPVLPPFPTARVARVLAYTHADTCAHTPAHVVYQIRFVKPQGGGEPSTPAGTLTFLDLAGSERSSKTGATGARLKEGANINKSLSALGDVISALAGQHKYVPWRNSKITMLLQPYMSGEGQSHTAFFAMVAPTRDNIDESLSTLRYAERVASIGKRLQEEAAMKAEGEPTKVQSLGLAYLMFTPPSLSLLKSASEHSRNFHRPQRTTPRKKQMTERSTHQPPKR